MPLTVHQIETELLNFDLKTRALLAEKGWGNKIH